MTVSFDYEMKLWAAHEVEAKPTYLGALRLEYALRDLASIHGKVLEIGCGGGSMTRAIKRYRPQVDVYGCDISERAIEFGRSRSGGVEFRVGDVYDLPFASGEMAAILMFDVLEHLAEPRLALAEIRRTLMPGGLFHLYVPCEGELLSLSGVLMRLGWKGKEKFAGHIQRFTRSDLERLLRAQGFEVTQVMWSGHAAFQLADTLFFLWLSLRGRNIPWSVEVFLDSANDTFRTKVIRHAKSGLAQLTYYESKCLAGVPGAGAHFTCRKAD